MNIYEVTVTEFNDDFVKYTFSIGGSGTSGRKWFPNVEVGQVWEMTYKGALVVECVRIK